MILLGALTLFVLSNPNSLTLFVNYTTKELGLSYEKVSGNLLQTVTLQNIRYHNHLLAKEASINWNMKALLTASLKIDEIIVKELNIPLTEQWIKDLNHKFASNKSKKVQHIPIIEISEIVFSALPFSQGDITVKRIELQANNIKGDLHHIDIGSVSFLTQNNYADITALARIKAGTLYFEKLWLENIDIKKVITLVKKLQNDTKTQQQKKGEKQTFIKNIQAQSIIINILPTHYQHYDIKHTTLTCNQLSSNLKTINAKHIFIDTYTNIWNLSSDGQIKNNKLYTSVKVDVNNTYFKRFVPFFNLEKLNPIAVNLQVNQKGLSGNIKAKTDTLLISKYRDYNVSLPNISAHVDFDFTKVQMDGEINATLKSKYTKESNFNTRIYYHDTFTYDGTGKLNLSNTFPKKLKKILNHVNLTFYGNIKNITAYAKTPYLDATYKGTNYQKENLYVTLSHLTPKLMKIEVPHGLESLEGKIKADIPINFKQFFPLNINYTLFSNAIDINGTVNYKKDIKTNATISLSKNSIIKNIIPRLKTNALFPAKVNLNYHKNKTNIIFKSKWINTKIFYDFNSTNCDASCNLDNQTLYLKGTIDQKFNIFLNSPSIREFQNTLAHIYTFKKLPVDGAVFVQTTITNKSKIQTAIKSKWFVYEYKPNHFAFAEKLRLNTTYNNHLLTLNNYYFSTYLDRDRIFFANRPSKATINKKKQINIAKVWVNDAIIINGKYSIKQGSGTLRAHTKNYHYDDLEGNFYFDSDINLKLQKKATSIEGFIQLNKGTITYQHRKEHYVQDEDIIIIQKKKSDTNTTRPETISVDLSLKTKEPIVYKIPNTDVKISADLKLWKEKKQNLELLGMIKILSGMHTEGDKEFEIQPSEILFAGPLLNPYLNIRAIHESDPYKIYININGQLDAPLINFSATPFLTQSDILSILLFNATTNDLISGSQDKSKTAISMFGNAFAKEIVQNFGIKLDKLVLSTTQEGKFGIEVGKKLSKKLTLIYINDIVQTIKVRYKMSNHFESDFIFSPDNSGVDIIYKDEY